MAGGQPVTHPAGLVPQAGLVDDVDGRAEASGEVTDADPADGQFPVRGDGTVFGKKREQVAAPGAGQVGHHDRHLSHHG